MSDNRSDQQRSLRRPILLLSKTPFPRHLTLAFPSMSGAKLVLVSVPAREAFSFASYRVRGRSGPATHATCRRAGAAAEIGC
jgi:hypothetical protein